MQGADMACSTICCVEIQAIKIQQHCLSQSELPHFPDCHRTTISAKFHSVSQIFNVFKRDVLFTLNDVFCPIFSYQVKETYIRSLHAFNAALSTIINNNHIEKKRVKYISLSHAISKSLGIHQCIFYLKACLFS